MPFKYKFKAADKANIPADQLTLYKETKLKNASGVEEDWFVLEVEGAVDQDRFVEFRTNNIALKARVTELENTWNGLNPVEVKEVMAVKEKYDAKKLIDEGKLTEAVELRVSAMKTENAKLVTGLTEQNRKLSARLEEVEIGQAVITAGADFGLKPEAFLDIVSRAKQTFKLVDGVPTALDKDGETPVYGKNGTDPITIKEWVEGLTTTATHFFEPNSGSGATGRASGSRTNPQVNPWKKDSFNLTEQGAITKANPALAAQLKKAAGA